MMEKWRIKKITRTGEMDGLLLKETLHEPCQHKARKKESGNA